MTQPNIVWEPANNANFMLGRQDNPVRHIAFHHVVGSAASAISKFQSASVVSAHFIVSPTTIYCMVDTDNTAYTNGNWQSNLESVTIEHEGDWRNGFRNQATLDNSARLVAWLQTLYPQATPIRHRDVSSTACPGDLPVEEIWAAATALNAPPAPVQPEWLKNRTPLVATKYANKGNIQLWNLTNPSQPADTRTFPLNQEFSIASKTRVSGQDYFITAYSTGKNIAAGYRAADLSDTLYVAPKPPVTPQPVVPPTLDQENNNLLKQILAIVTFIKDKLTSVFK